MEPACDNARVSIWVLGWHTGSFVGQKFKKVVSRFSKSFQMPNFYRAIRCDRAFINVCDLLSGGRSYR